jgi:hypothetical protein
VTPNGHQGMPYDVLSGDSSDRRSTCRWALDRMRRHLIRIATWRKRPQSPMPKRQPVWTRGCCDLTRPSRHGRRSPSGRRQDPGRAKPVNNPVPLQRRWLAAVELGTRLASPSPRPSRKVSTSMSGSM